MDAMRQTWSAGQIGASYGAYSGKTVSFMFNGAKVTGTLDRSDGSMNKGPTGRVMLVVNGISFFVGNSTPVEAA